MKPTRLFTLALIAAACAAAPLVPGPALAQSLDTRRTLKEIQDKDVPDFEKRASDAAGTPITVELDAGSFGDNKSALEAMRFYVFPNLVAALKTVAKDDLGKKALAEKLKKIHVMYDLKVNDAKSLTLKDGTLHIPYAYGGGSYLTETQFKSFLEQSL